jgi:hypothetical protein
MSTPSTEVSDADVQISTVRALNLPVGLGDGLVIDWHDQGAFCAANAR